MSGTVGKTKIKPAKEPMLEPRKKNSQNDQLYYIDAKFSTMSHLDGLSEKNYHDLYDKTPCLLCSTTVDGIIYACNEFYAKKLGYQKNDVLGKSIFEHTAEKSIKNLRNEMERWKTTHEISNVEIWMKRKDGSIFPILLTGTSLFDKNEKLIGRTSALLDLTEIHKARKMLNFNQGQIKKQIDELKKSNMLLVKTEQKYRDLYENSPDLLRTINLEGIILDCNNSYCKYLGYSKKEVIGMSVFDFVATQSVDAYVNSFETWKTTGTVSNTKVWFKRKDNSEFLGLINATNLYDFDGKLVGSNTTIRDISDLYAIRKTLEDNENKLKQRNEALTTAYDHLLETEQRYRTLYEKSPDLLRTVDLNENLIDCNDAYCTSLGYQREEIMGKSLFTHVAERSIKDLQDALIEWDKTGFIENREIWLQKKNGDIFPTLLLSTNLYDTNGKLTGRIGALRDMSAIYAAKKEIEEHKTKRLSAIGELSARIAHDLRNPLSVINNTLEIIKIQNPNFEKTNQEKFDRIERAVKRMTHQIEEVMDYVVPHPLNLQKASLLGILNSAIANVKTNGIEIHVPQNDVSMMCDSEKLEIVFTNLMLNATQAMSNRGNIHLRIKEGTINDGQNKDFATIEIEDTGPGIPKSLLPKIFDPLFTTRQIGTGLGLASCKNIIEKHGGFIDIKTEVDKGTTFIINIPK
ncbi:MAG: PAS domain-containing sensor histidine kinase [Nitrosotalea sp.]